MLFETLYTIFETYHENRLPYRVPTHIHATFVEYFFADLFLFCKENVAQTELIRPARP